MLLLLVPGVGMGGSLEASPPPEPEVTTVAVRPSGGYPAYEYDRYRKRRTRRELSEIRQRFGLDDGYREERAAQVIATVAARQADALEQDQLKQFEELSRQLQIEGLEFDRRYLQALNAERERLIEQEIGRRLRMKMEEEELILILIASES